jgi:hypothetical protein
MTIKPKQPRQSRTAREKGKSDMVDRAFDRQVEIAKANPIRQPRGPGGKFVKAEKPAVEPVNFIDDDIIPMPNTMPATLERRRQGMASVKAIIWPS